MIAMSFIAGRVAHDRRDGILAPRTHSDSMKYRCLCTSFAILAGCSGDEGANRGVSDGPDASEEAGANTGGRPEDGGVASGGDRNDASHSGGTAAGGPGPEASTDASVPPWSPATGQASGTRLRARLWDTLAGAAIFREWVDTELDTACSFDRTAD